MDYVEINSKKELSEEEMLSIVTKQVKLRKDAVKDFEKAGRQDLIDSYNEEIDILNEYLPKPLTMEEINSIIDAIDISKEALSVAIDNAKINNVDINFMLADMTTYKDKKYDVIISNPPYIKKDELIMDMVKDNEPNIALYADDNGLYYYKKIIDNINYLTNDKYLICFEIGYTQGKYIEEYAKDNLSDITVSIEKDYNDRDRFIFITNIK